MLIREYVETLDTETLLRLMRDYEEFESKGFIGDCALREHATNLSREMRIRDSSITIMMDRLMMEVFRRMAYQHIDRISS